MRRIVPFALFALAVTGCDPTGRTDFTGARASLRVVNLVTDAPAIRVWVQGTKLLDSVAFGEVSVDTSVLAGVDAIDLYRRSDNASIGADAVSFSRARHYTLYALGTVAAHVYTAALDDTVNAAAGSFKMRFVHGAKVQSGISVDVYLSLPSDSLGVLTPDLTNIAYGSASTYFTADTAHRRLRITSAGLPTVLFDTTLATGIASGSNVTFAVSDTAGGGEPLRFMVVVDKTP